MGTFHHGKSELHGITVAVDTLGPRIYVGRCDDMDDESIWLLDVDEHTDGDGGRTKKEYLARAIELGTWTRHKQLRVPRKEVKWVKPLGTLDPNEL